MTMNSRMRPGASLYVRGCFCGLFVCVFPPIDMVVASESSDPSLTTEQAPALARSSHIRSSDAVEAERLVRQYSLARQIKVCDCFNIEADWSRYLRYGQGDSFSEYIERRLRAKRLAGPILIGASVPALVVGPGIIYGDYTKTALGGLLLGGGMIVSAIGVGLTIVGVRRLKALQRVRKALGLANRHFDIPPYRY